jgi:protein-tyrosine phosphatase
MIDLHAHILPGLDDGAKDVDESLAMCLVAARDGITEIVATPHTGNGSYDNSPDRILAAVEDLNGRLKENGIGLLIRPGADIYIHERLGDLVKDRKVLTVNDNMRYVMVEFPRHVVPPNYLEWMFHLTLAGVTPVLTHPERNTAVNGNTDIVRKWVEKGGLVQLTAMSISGGFGPEIRKCSEELLRYNLVHVIASDAHSADKRPPKLSKALRAASSIIGAEHARRLVEDYPAAIVAGKPFYPPEPIRKKLGIFSRFFVKSEF